MLLQSYVSDAVIKTHLKCEMCLFPLHISRSPFLCPMWRRCRRSTSWTVLKTQRSASGKHPVVVFLIIWLLHISVIDDVKLIVHAGGCASVWGHIGRKPFPWRWRWLLNRAEWNSLAHSSGKFIQLFWEVHSHTYFCNFLATASNRAHFCFQVSRAHQVHFTVHLLTSFSLSPLGKFTTSPSTATRQWRLLRSTVQRCTPSQPWWWPKIWKSMAKILLSDLLIHKLCFYAST